MTREERLQKIALDLAGISEDSKRTKKEREGLVGEFFRLLDAGYNGRQNILPVKTIDVPDEFWETTGMSYETFTESRFPGWSVEHIEKNISTNKTTIVMKRDAGYLPAVVEVEDGDEKIKVAKEVSEYTPEVDWETLNAERPDLFERLAKYRTVIELDDDALEQIAMEEPEELATLERHMRVKSPTLRVTSRRLKNDG